MKKKIVLSSVATIIVCLSLIIGSTYALFTDEASIDISAKSAKVDIEAYIDQNSLEKWSLDVDRTAEDSFTNGGTANFVNSQLVLDRVSPGDGVKFNIVVENNSNIAIKYNVQMVVDYDTTGLTQEQIAACQAFADALVAKATINGTTYDITGVGTETGFVLVPENTTIDSIPVTIELPWQTGNEAQDANVTVSFILVAIQGNGEELYLGLDTDTETGTDAIETEETEAVSEEIVSEEATESEPAETETN